MRRKWQIICWIVTNPFIWFRGYFAVITANTGYAIAIGAMLRLYLYHDDGIPVWFVVFQIICASATYAVLFARYEQLKHTFEGDPP